MNLAARIRQRREHQGLRQNDIANALQVSPQAVSKWERGENAPDIMTLPKLAGLLGVTTDWLLGRDERDRDVVDATVFASSVAGAYARSLEMDSSAYAAWANGIFTQITEAVMRHEGVPLKYLGDQFLGFFSGPDQHRRAMQAARLARQIVGESLFIGLSCGPVYFGTIGHPDYARADIMGQTVNSAFLTVGWALENADSGIAATRQIVDALGDDLGAETGEPVRFLQTDHAIEVFQIDA
ncbi:MAG: helix-turn-helix domain-containing protein [Candidatus Sumerlaeota bacterium]